LLFSSSGQIQVFAAFKITVSVNLGIAIGMIFASVATVSSRSHAELRKKWKRYLDEILEAFLSTLELNFSSHLKV